MGISYRVRQFWRVISTKTDTEALTRARNQLSPALRSLFDQLQPSEQYHAVSMWQQLRHQGNNQADLLTAALLHDIGKLRYPLKPWERGLIVLAKAVMPKNVNHWGNLPNDEWDDLPAWRKTFIVSEQHARWGAEMVHKAGASPMVEYLIREHHHPHNQELPVETDTLLYKLWLVDNES